MNTNPTIKVKRSLVQGKTPTLEQLGLGELAINHYDGKLFIRQDTQGVGIGTTVISIGTQGIQGITGEQGIQGITGAGTQGIQGITGEQGIQGITGSQGIQGIDGQSYNQGIQGITGAQGIQGITGAGTQGIQGTAGEQGIQGIQGIQGVDGQSYNQGIQGITGAQGIQGSQGITGAGTQGIQGINGAQGIQGIQGVDGQSYNQGIQGIQGIKGEDGIIGVNGSQGIQGIQGTTGSTGSQGIQGTTGSTGSQGIQGTTGSTGSQGIQGIQGTTGSTGSTGSQGIQGIQGTTGSTGSTGSQGIQGTTGSTGSQGIQGIQGTTGSTGSTGSQGIQGTTGSTGSQGIQGAGGLTTTNADTLDSLDSTQFLRSDTSDTFDGQTGSVLTVRMVDGQNAASTNGGLGPIQVYQNSNVTNSDAFMTFHISNRYATYFGLDRETNDLFTGGWSDGAVKHKIWHAGNDGSGSGLDADLLDGINSLDFSRLVHTTATGGTGAADGANTWTKIATFSTGTTQFADCTLILSITNTVTADSDSAIIHVFFRSNSTSTNPTVDVEILSKGGTGSLIVNDSFKVISGGWTTDMELWMKKGNNYGCFAVYETSKRLQGGTLTYNASPAWQSTTPTGAVNNVSSDGVYQGLKLTANGTVQGTQLISTVATGTAPLTVSSTTLVSNLNADLLDNLHSSQFLRSDTNSIQSAGGTRYNDGVSLSFGTSADFSINHTGTVNQFNSTNGDFIFTSAGTTKFTFERTTGNFTATGTVTASSDIKLKDNIKVIENPIEKITQIRGVTFTRNDLDDKEKRHAGVIAQEVEKVLPEVVLDNSGTKSVAYGNLVALLIEAIKEQQTKIDSIEKKLEDLINKQQEI